MHSVRTIGAVFSMCALLPFAAGCALDASDEGAGSEEADRIGAEVSGAPSGDNGAAHESVGESGDAMHWGGYSAPYGYYAPGYDYPIYPGAPGYVAFPGYGAYPGYGYCFSPYPGSYVCQSGYSYSEGYGYGYGY